MYGGGIHVLTVSIDNPKQKVYGRKKKYCQVYPRGGLSSTSLRKFREKVLQYELLNHPLW